MKKSKKTLIILLWCLPLLSGCKHKQTNKTTRNLQHLNNNTADDAATKDGIWIYTKQFNSAGYKKLTGKRNLPFDIIQLTIDNQGPTSVCLHPVDVSLPLVTDKTITRALAPAYLAKTLGIGALAGIILVSTAAFLYGALGSAMWLGTGKFLIGEGFAALGCYGIYTITAGAAIGGFSALVPSGIYTYAKSNNILAKKCSYLTIDPGQKVSTLLFVEKQARTYKSFDVILREVKEQKQHIFKLSLHKQTDDLPAA